MLSVKDIYKIEYLYDDSVITKTSILTYEMVENKQFTKITNNIIQKKIEEESSIIYYMDESIWNAFCKFNDNLDDLDNIKIYFKNLNYQKITGNVYASITLNNKLDYEGVDFGIYDLNSRPTHYYFINNLIKEEVIKIDNFMFPNPYYFAELNNKKDKIKYVIRQIINIISFYFSIKFI